MDPHQPVRSTRVVIVDDHALFAGALDLALTRSGYDARCVVPRAGDRSPRQLVATVLRLRPDVVLLDLDLGPGLDGLQLVQPLAEAGVDVVVLTASTSRGRWGETVDAGARIVLSKAFLLKDVVSTVRLIERGADVLAEEDRQELLRLARLDRAGDGAVRDRLAKLSQREAQVLAHLVRGNTVPEIAQLDVVAEVTVRSQVKAILYKLEVRTQLAAVALAFQVRWRPPPRTGPGEDPQDSAGPGPAARRRASARRA